ncbi:hypothetical protein F5051DRAFT_431784 [Lentinula edodes]|nr:hypothetical protein F5051DRAFT_431784 [Lentinula edodes]KAJ3893520.1 hypothetical protein GG344DRAFT_63657 [Lentinula edodes]
MGLVFAIMLSLLGLAIVGFDILQGVQSSCTHNTLSSETLSGVMTYISLAAFDILATSLVTNRMMQDIRGCGGFRKLASGMQLGVLYFGYGFPIVTRGINSDLGMSRVVTIPQIIAVVLYLVGVLLVQKKSSFATFEPRHGSYRSGDFRDSTALSSTTFFSCLREMNESRRESIPDEASLDQATTLSTYDLFNSTNRTQWWAGGTSLVADFDAEIEMR